MCIINKQHRAILLMYTKIKYGTMTGVAIIQQLAGPALWLCILISIEAWIFFLSWHGLSKIEKHHWFVRCGLYEIGCNNKLKWKIWVISVVEEDYENSNYAFFHVKTKICLYLEMLCLSKRFFIFSLLFNNCKLQIHMVSNLLKYVCVKLCNYLFCI